MTSHVAPTDAERLHEAYVWATQRYIIHLGICPARLDRRPCQMCEDLDWDEWLAAIAYSRAIRP